MVSLLLPIIYLSFISLGLPDCMLGAAWPTMYPEFQVPVSYAGIISMIIAFGTIVSSLQSDRLTRRLGTGRVTVLSVGLTALSLLGFSFSHSFPLLCVLALPYGLGAGSVDASLNNYVALHYESRHMSWLHCMWGVGAATGPYVMGFVLTHNQPWNMGYRIIGLLQIVLTLILFFSLPLWKSRPVSGGSGDSGSEASNSETSASKASGQDTSDGDAPLSLRQVLSITGAKEILIAFFCYCALEQTALLWSASYFVMKEGLTPERAASLASLFAIGITGGRALSGFLTMRFSDVQMVRIGQGTILLGLIILLLPFGTAGAVVGLVLTGLGCAPIYPCLIHSTPDHFGAENSQAVIGVQMASAYIGTLAMPPLFGLIAQHITIALFPVYMLIILCLMVFMHERLVKVCVR